VTLFRERPVAADARSYTHLGLLWAYSRSDGKPHDAVPDTRRW